MNKICCCFLLLVLVCLSRCEILAFESENSTMTDADIREYNALLADNAQFEQDMIELSSDTGACPTCCKLLTSRPAQTYHYYQNTAHFVGGSGDWHINTKGYSGAGAGRNNPKMQCVKNTGPAPAATYKLSACVDYMHGNVPRPCSFIMSPQAGSSMCGRNAFLVHGCQSCTNCDTQTPPCGSCSAGCVVINVKERMKIRVGDTLIVHQYE